MPKQTWDDWYEKLQLRSKGRAAKTKFISEQPSGYLCQYSDYLLWNVIFKKYLHKHKDAKVLEVGSAPGDFLIRLHKTYGFTPYGVEYSQAGVVQNREIFASNGINPDNVILADFFDDAFQHKFKGYFDIVVSRGFIEHFTDVQDVIEKHLNVLAEGGYLIVSIPNISPRSIYGVCSFFIDKKRLKTHNLNIMSKKAFASLFNKTELSSLFCGYYGTLRLSLLGGSKNFIIRVMLFACNKLQTMLNPVFRIVLQDRGLESRCFSPFLLYIGLRQGRKDTARQQL